MRIDVQATGRRGDSSVQRLSSRLNGGKAIKTGLDNAHEPPRLVALKKQPLGQVCKEQCAATSKCAGPKLTVTDRLNQSRFTRAPIAIKKDKSSLAFYPDHSRPSSGAKIDSGAPIICHVLSIRLAQRFSYSESFAFEVGERLDGIVRRAGRSFGCTIGELKDDRTRTRAPDERGECPQNADISLFRAFLFMVDDPRASACHCVHRCGDQHYRVLINEAGSV